jgi:hypothetical protein
VKSPEQVRDPVVMLLGNKLATSDPVVNDRVVFFQQTLELTKFFSVEPSEALICKGADQQIGLGRTAAPSAEFQLATKPVERFPIVRHWGNSRIGSYTIQHCF